jgi:hypothetical protein
MGQSHGNMGTPGTEIRAWQLNTTHMKPCTTHAWQTLSGTNVLQPSHDKYVVRATSKPNVVLVRHVTKLGQIISQIYKKKY